MVARDSRAIDCIQVGMAPSPCRRSSWIAAPWVSSARTALRRRMIADRFEGNVSCSQCNAWTTRMAGRPAQYRRLGALVLKMLGLS